MPDLLDRATVLLDRLGDDPARARTLAALSAATGIPPAAASRLLHRLVALGWADQEGPRGAFRLGPRAYALAGGGVYRRRLAEAARPAMSGLAAAHPGTGVVLMALRAWTRQLVWECGLAAGRDTGPDGGFRLAGGELWATASGRVLIAGLTPRARAAWIARIGLPTAREWKGIATRAELLAALAGIRRAGEAERPDAPGGRRAIAVPVPDGEGGVAALGVHHPRGEAAAVDGGELRAAAARIAARLACG
jgi:DNA-binding IclR family transcriptional regulator